MKQNAPQVFTPLASDKLTKEINSIGKTGNRLNTRIQFAALNSIWYSIKHGDVGFGQRLVEALTKGQRKNSLVKFLETYGQFKWDNEKKNVVFFKRPDLKEDIVSGISKMWYDAIKEEAIDSIYDFEKMATSFI